MSNFDFSAIKKILIVRLSSIGDIVQTLPVASVLRTNFPRAKIDWITEEPSFNLLLTNEFLDNVLVFPRHNWQNLLKKRMFKSFHQEFKIFAQQLKDAEYDLVFDFHNIFRSGLVTGLTNAPRRWGYGSREANTFFLTNRFPPIGGNLHVTDGHLVALKEIGLPKSNVDFGFKAITRPGFVQTDQPFVIIHPFSRWKTKNWSLENYFKLAKEVASYGFKIYFTGSQDDAPAIEGILKKEPSFTSLAGRTSLQEFIALTQRANLFIGGDTGPMHIAAANCPVIAVMGPTSSIKYGPYGQTGSTVKADIPCLGCHRRYCAHQRCMKLLTPEMVLDAVKKKIEQGGGSNKAIRKQ